MNTNEKNLLKNLAVTKKLRTFVSLNKQKGDMKNNNIIEVNACRANNHEYVDLGLPSGTLWATCNVGASTPTEYGKYFQWGATVGYEGEEAKAHSRWETAPFNNGTNEFDEAYFKTIKDTVCPNGVLAPEYDGVHANMGGDWRMPTKEDFNELFAGTTDEWVEDYQGTGVNGCLFTSMSNGNTIFIPTSGEAWNGYLDDQGILAYLWSSSLDASDPNYAWYLNSDSDVYGVYHSYRYFGFCLRGVL